MSIQHLIFWFSQTPTNLLVIRSDMDMVYTIIPGILFTNLAFIQINLSYLAILTLSTLLFGQAYMIIKGLKNKKLLKRAESEKKLYEQQLQVNRNRLKKMTDITDKAKELRNNFLANMSHEIKTPLNTILGATHLLNTMTTNQEVLEVVNSINRSSQSLLRLTNDLLDFNKLELGELVLDELNFNLQQEIQEVIDNFRHPIEEKYLDFHIEINENLPEYVKGDPQRLKQILVNILDNAVKFTVKGSIKLSVELVKTNNNHHELRFIVTDTGIGIPNSKQDSIWTVFSMEDESLTRKTGGSGLGLSVSRKLCHLMNGDIFLRSESGKGTSFWFIIKLSKGEKINELVMRQHAKTSILLVEDNQINQKIAISLLTNQGYQLSVANNGKEAVEKFQEKHFHIILMDIQMPMMDGIEAAKRIRKIESERGVTMPVRIIALTANSHKEDRKRCMEAGMNDYISKPFNINKLPLIMTSMISESQDNKV